VERTRTAVVEVGAGAGGTLRGGEVAGVVVVVVDTEETTGEGEGGEAETTGEGMGG
jgi:hypothetical protein